MMRTEISAAIGAALTLLLASVAQATTIGFAPSSTTVEFGDSITLDVVISDLGGEIVSAYDLDLIYNSALLSATSVTFGPSLGDESLFEVFSDSDLTGPGVVDFAQLSLLSDASLLALQGGDSFVLASVSFDVTGTGTSTLDFVFDPVNDIKGANALRLDVTVAPGFVTSIPEPSAALVFSLGAAILVAGSRRRR